MGATIRGTVISEGMKITLRRERLGWKSQQQLADRAGISRATVWKIENDKKVEHDMWLAVVAVIDAEERQRGLTSLGLDTQGQDGLGSAHPRQSLEIVRAPDPIRQGDAYQSDVPRGAANAVETRIRELEQQLNAEKAAHAEMRGIAARLTELLGARLQSIEARLPVSRSRKRR